MIFGINSDKGIVQDGLGLKVVTIGQDGYTLEDILVHNAKDPNPFIHLMLVSMKLPDFPVVFGVIRAVEDEHTYDEKVELQIQNVQSKAKIKTMDDLLNSGETWEVK